MTTEITIETISVTHDYRGTTIEVDNLSELIVKLLAKVEPVGLLSMIDTSDLEAYLKDCRGE